MAERVVKIEYWYNRSERSWVIQLKNSKGWQIGDSDYLGHKSHLEAQLKYYRKKYPKAKVVHS